MRTILLFLGLAMTMSCYAQKIPADKQFYSVNIFRYAKDANDELTDRLVLINADGSVTYNGEENYMQLDIAEVTKGFTKYIKGEKIAKTPAYGEEQMEEAHIPELGEQALHITVVKMEDYLRDKDNFLYPAEYFQLIVLPVNKTPESLYKYLSKDIVAALKKMLEE